MRQKLHYFGKVADDFQRLGADIAKAWGPVRLANEIGRVKGVFKFGYESGLLDKPPRYGPQFKKPSAKVLRKVRAERGLRMFEREELLSLLNAALPLQRAMDFRGGCGRFYRYFCHHRPAGKRILG